MATRTARRRRGGITQEELRCMDAYWRATNYLSVGQIYLRDNPLVREPLRPEHVEPRLLGHRGITARTEHGLRYPRRWRMISIASTGVADVIDRVPRPGALAAYAKQRMRDKLIEHAEYIVRHGEGMPEVREWTWPY